MKYRDREIKELSDDSLVEAHSGLVASLKFYNSQIVSPRYKERIGNRQIANINPHFTELKKAIEEELTSRNLIFNKGE